MKFQRRTAISPVIASLLLIAIAVAAGIIVYIYVNSLSGGLAQGGGQQVSERLQMQSYNFQSPVATCACPQKVLDIVFLNSGGSSTQISAVYFDGTPLTQGTITAANTDQAIANNQYFALASSITFSSGTANDIQFSTTTQTTTFASQSTGQVILTFTPAAGAGTSHVVKVVSLTGGTYVFSVTSGRTG